MTGRVWMVLSLVLTCVVAAVALAAVYGITRPVIDRQAADAVTRALSEALPAAHHFEPIIPDSLWYGLDSAGQKVGIVLRTAPRGYAGPVVTMAGVGLDGRVFAVIVAAQGLKETPGLGLKALEPRFREQFAGKTAVEVRLRKDGGTVDAISAATITSRAIANGLSAALERYADHLGQ